MFKAKDGPLAEGMVLIEPVDQLTMPLGLVAGLEGLFDASALFDVPKHHIECVLGDINANIVAIVLHRGRFLRHPLYQAPAATSVLLRVCSGAMPQRTDLPSECACMETARVFESGYGLYPERV